MRLAQCIRLLFFLAGLCLMRVFSGGPVSAPQKEKANLIQEGVLTERQREHSKLFKAHGSGQELTDLATQEGEIKIRSVTPLPGGDPNSPIKTQYEALRHDACIAEGLEITMPAKQALSDSGLPGSLSDELKK